MKVILQNCTRPSFNLAVEEYLLKQTNEEYFMLWRNDRAVIVGRNQNTHAEINEDFVKANNISVIRRMTGGGAVFHDLGNVNYTFITRGGSYFNNYAFFARPVLAALEEMGVKAELSGRNDMIINQKKFSGNAQCTHNDDTMHHGTLMFNADISSLSDALRVNPLKIKSKGIASVKSRVTNLSEYLPEDMTVQEFMGKIKQKVMQLYPTAEEYELSQKDIAAIEKLEKEKYATYEWNFGFKQAYEITKEARFNAGTVCVCFNIKEDKVADCKVQGDFFGTHDVVELQKRLLGASYNPSGIAFALKNVNIEDYISGVTTKDFCNFIV